MFGDCKTVPQPSEKHEYNALKDVPLTAPIPTYKGQQLSHDEYMKWTLLGEKWFRGETFGNERLWTDVIGLFNASLDIPDGKGGWVSEPFFKLMLESIDNLDSVRGNLFTGNGGPDGIAYTNDLIVELPKGAMLDKTFPLPEKLHTGLDVEAGSPWPIGIVPVPVSPDEEGLPYLYNPGAFASGPKGIGPSPRGKYRLGVSCALCHYSLDVDWDGKPDLKSAKYDHPTPGSRYNPQDAWAIGNQDISLGVVMAMSANTIAGFETSGHPGNTTQTQAREWAAWVRDNYKAKPDEVRREVDRGLLAYPRGYADDTPDGLHNPLQFPSLFTLRNWPYNYDGVMVNATDRNNNVWTVGLDLTGLVGLCNDRSGILAGYAFWEEKGFYSELSANDYASIVTEYSPAVCYDPSIKGRFIADILGVSDGVPGMLRPDAVSVIDGIPEVLTKDVLNTSKEKNLVKSPSDYQPDGKERGAMLALLGTRIKTPPEVWSKYDVKGLEEKYGINGDEFVTQCVSMMLDWVQPPANKSQLLKNAYLNGLVDRGYEIFKSEGCIGCHSGPIFTNNKIILEEEIKTNPARAKATEPLKEFFSPLYDPTTGISTTGGFWAFLEKIFFKPDELKGGYKVLTLRYVWGSAPYLHDGGVGVALKPGIVQSDDNLKELLSCPDTGKIYGIAQILGIRETNEASHFRPNAALSLQALLLESERNKVICANNLAVYPVPGSSKFIPISSLQIEGIGHEYWVKDDPGGDKITALIAFLLALDNDPRR